ncbi:MAG: hypothetical protein R6V05_10810 [Candidatus Brocadiia bacterium]
MSQAAEGHELLRWEELGRGSPGRALVSAAAQLVRDPGGFFGRMARSGGLNEPLVFFLTMLGALVVVAFPAALSYFGLTAPDASEVPVRVYQWHALPPKATGVMLGLLPEVLVVGAVLAVLSGSLFYLPGRAFGGGRWEGSVSVWLYALGAALLPMTAAAGVLLLISLAGYLLSIPLPTVQEPATRAARVAAMALLPAGGLVGLVVLVRNLVTGCARAFGLDAVLGPAAALSGLLLVAVTLAVCAGSFRYWGFRWGLLVSGAAVAVTILIAVLGRRGVTENTIGA